MIPISLKTYPTGDRLVTGPMRNFNKPKKERPIIFSNRFIGCKHWKGCLINVR